MNIAIITDSFPPMIDGVGRCAYAYTKALHEGGYGQCIAVAPKMPQVKDDYPFNVYSFRSLKFPYGDYRAGYPFMPSLIKKLKAMDIDILHAHSPFISMPIANKLRRKLKVPIVFTQHTKWDYDLETALPLKPLRRIAEHYIHWSIGKADEVWAVSQGAGEHLNVRGYNGDFTVMPNGTDYEKCEPNPEMQKRINERFDLPDGVPVLLFVGRMMWYKNIGMILDTLELLKKTDFDFRMLFVGDGEHMDEIKDATTEKGLDDVVSFVGRIDDREELMSYYERADLFLLMSIYDNAPVVVLEAAASACPALVLRGSATSEVIEDGVNGYHVGEDPGEAADAIRMIFSDLKRHEEVSRAAAEQVYIPWDRLMVRVVEGYERVIDDYKKNQKEKKSRRKGKQELSSLVAD